MERSRPSSARVRESSPSTAPCNTVMIPSASFMFIRHGVLMAAHHSSGKLALVPPFSPAATPHLHVKYGKGYILGHCYDPAEDKLYILTARARSCWLYVHSLAEDASPRTRSVSVQGMADFGNGCPLWGVKMASVGGRVYLFGSPSFFQDDPRLICLDARDSASSVIRAQVIRHFADSQSFKPISLVVSDEQHRDECVLCVIYCDKSEGWVYQRLSVIHWGGKVSSVCSGSWPLRGHGADEVEYRLLRKNLLLFYTSKNEEGRYSHSLCDEQGHDLGMARVQRTPLQASRALIADDGTIYIKSGDRYRSVSRVHAFYSQARRLTDRDASNWLVVTKSRPAHPAEV
ncbi:hypothetical protein FOZ63_007374 [Perkinsus olseni]|uniref:Uncharacterized protein n=1 Tax=Perkinsus olseni TaxID=32597 RepID=A0A7J6UQG1_PEROL|nr:hypothetical protein FOZ63_007374 [Perkinsus olseni]